MEILMRKFTKTNFKDNFREELLEIFLSFSGKGDSFSFYE
jgi:hypothetical protein